MFLKRLFVLLFAIFSATVSAQTTGLSFRPAGAAYSSALDRIIFISGNPNQLHIYDPVAHADQTVSLPEAPANLSLSADGLYAAVALVDSVSYVSLQNASVQTFTNVAVGGGVAILGPGYIYIFPSYEGSVLAIQLSNGQVTTSLSYQYASGGVFNPAVSAIYSSQNGLSPNDISRYNVSGATVNNGVDSPYFDVFSMCGPLWLSPDNSKIYTACGTVFASSSDTTKDMRYLGILGSLTSIQSLAPSSALNQIAAIPVANPYNSTPTADTQVDLFDSAYYNPIGVFQTNPFTVGGSTYAAHGRYVFYNSSSSKMFVVTQADSTAGLEMDYAIDTINLQNANSCSATFASGSAGAIAAGSYATTQILAGEDCAFTAVSSVPWITLTSGYYGSGNTALNYLVRPNLTGSARSGNITLGSQSFSVTQSAAGTASSVNPLSINPVAADYSKGMDKIVMVNSSPNELHIYDPVSLADQIVPLSGAPLSVSVEPDGLFAAVGHHGFLSYVDLSTASVSKTIPIDMDIGGILLAGNGYAYAFPSHGYGLAGWDSVQISTGTLSGLGDLYGGNIPRLYPGGAYIYVGGGAGTTKYNISAGPAAQVNGTALGGPSGNIWLSEDGVRLISSTGQAYFTSAIASQDLQPGGSLSAASNVAWAANSQVHHQTAVLTGAPSCCNVSNAQLQIYSDNGLQLQSQEAMPSFTAGGTSYPSHGQYLFWNAAETELFAITNAASTSGLLSNFAVNTIAAPESIPTCSYSVSPSTIYLGPSGYGASINVTSACNWTAVPGNSSWLYVSDGSAIGNGSAGFTVSPNTGPQRSQTLTIGTQTVTVVQAASTCTYTLSTNNAEFPLSGGTATVDLTTQSSCPWSVQSNASWLTTGTQSGTGSASIQFTAAASTSYQSGSINIAGNNLYVTEASLPASTALNFVPVTPCRVADTRNPTGAFGGPYIAGFSTRSFTIPSSSCNIPSNAAAYSLNVAVVPHGQLGYLTAWATGQSRPYVSTINSDGRIKSTAAIVPAGTNGAASFYATNDTDLVLDINGYFVASSSNTGLNYYVLNPCRVLDTRNADGALGGPFLNPSQARDFPIQQSSCGVPTEAQAYSINLAVVPLAGELGALTLWPTGESQPNIASLNATTGAITSNAGLPSAGTSGDIEMLASNNTQAIIDINGYFAPASSSGLHLYTIQPCRALDTRYSGAEQPFNGTLTVMMGGICNIPSDASAVVVNATVVPVNTLGYLTLWADGQPQPVVATLNASDGAITSNLAIVPMVDGAIDAFATNATHLVVDAVGYFAP